MPTPTRAPKPVVEGWTARLQDGGMEIFLKVEKMKGVTDRKIRASGPEGEMLELVEWFEAKTGLRVTVPNRPRRGPKPIEGQTSLMGEKPELESEPSA